MTPDDLLLNFRVLAESLPTPPPGATSADQVRAMGLQVGDRIMGIAENLDGYHEALLEVLWIGAQVVVFKAQCRYGADADWEPPYESGAWSLAFRPWTKVRS